RRAAINAVDRLARNGWITKDGDGASSNIHGMSSNNYSFPWERANAEWKQRRAEIEAARRAKRLERRHNLPFASASPCTSKDDSLVHDGALANQAASARPSTLLVHGRTSASARPCTQSFELEAVKGNGRTSASARPCTQSFELEAVKGSSEKKKDAPPTAVAG